MFWVINQKGSSDGGCLYILIKKQLPINTLIKNN